jgi:hypothetical protein
LIGSSQGVRWPSELAEFVLYEINFVAQVVATQIPSGAFFIIPGGSGIVTGYLATIIFQF